MRKFLTVFGVMAMFAIGSFAHMATASAWYIVLNGTTECNDGNTTAMFSIDNSSEPGDATVKASNHTDIVPVGSVVKAGKAKNFGPAKPITAAYTLTVSVNWVGDSTIRTYSKTVYPLTNCGGTTTTTAAPTTTTTQKVTTTTWATTTTTQAPSTTTSSSVPPSTTTTSTSTLPTSTVPPTTELPTTSTSLVSSTTSSSLPSLPGTTTSSTTSTSTPPVVTSTTSTSVVIASTSTSVPVTSTSAAPLTPTTISANPEIQAATSLAKTGSDTDDKIRFAGILILFGLLMVGLGYFVNRENKRNPK